MESVLGRYRNLIILVGVLFLQVLGLAMQVKRSGSETDTRLIRIWAVGAISPFERSLVWIRNSTGNVWHNYFYLRGVRAENRELKQQIEEMRLERIRLTEDAAQAHRLQVLLSFKEQYVAKTVAAQVIGSSGSDLSRVVYIDKGENAGVRRDMAVITADGVVGKVLLAYPSVSQVLLINDQSSGVGALLEKSRLQGVLKGTVNGEVSLERVMSDEQVPVGENVITSGGDQIFPKGLPVGTVAKVSGGKDLFLNIKIRPAANLSKLEEVLVLLEKQEKLATAEDKNRVRAADILAQRLPSVPDRPAADAASVGVGAAGASKPANVTGSPATKTTSAVPNGGNTPAATGSNRVVGPAEQKKPAVPSTPTPKPKADNGASIPVTKQAAPAKPVATEQKAKPSSNTSSPPSPSDANGPQ